MPSSDSVLAYELEYSGTLYKNELEEALVNVTKTAPEKKKTVYPPYKPVIKLPLLESIPQLERPALVGRINERYRGQPAYTQELRYSTNTLKVLRLTHGALEQEFNDIKPVIEGLYDRALLQQEEFNLQIRKAQELNEKIEKMQSSNVKERLKRALEKQEALKKRADELLRKAVMSGSPALSEAEKKWVDEVGRVNNKINSANGFESKVKRMEALKSQLVAATPVREEQELGEILQQLQVNPEFKENSMQILSQMLAKEYALCSSELISLLIDIGTSLFATQRRGSGIWRSAWRRCRILASA